MNSAKEIAENDLHEIETTLKVRNEHIPELPRFKRNIGELLKLITPIPNIEDLVPIDLGMILGNLRVRTPETVDSIQPPLFLGSRIGAKDFFKHSYSELFFHQCALEAPFVIISVGTGNGFSQSEKAKMQNNCSRKIEFLEGGNFKDGPDGLSAGLPDALEKCTKWIDEWRLVQGSPVIVHCKEGMCRSVSVVIAWLLKNYIFGSNAMFRAQSLVSFKRNPIVYPIEQKNAWIEYYENCKNTFIEIHAMFKLQCLKDVPQFQRVFFIHNRNHEFAANLVEIFINNKLKN